jgi:hypothetical protein
MDRKGEIGKGEDRSALDRAAGIPVLIGNLHGTFHLIFSGGINQDPRRRGETVGGKKFSDPIQINFHIPSL